MIDVLARSLFQEVPAVLLADKSDRLQVGAAEAGAIDSIMNAGIFPDWPQDAVFDIVESEFPCPSMRASSASQGPFGTSRAKCRYRGYVLTG